MKTIKMILTLLDYDYPQVFIAIDAIETQYICMVVEIHDHEPSFLCTPISRQRKSALCSGKIDLLQAYASPEIEEFYVAKPSNLTEPFQIERADFSECPGYYLPDAGLVFSCEDEVLNKAQELGATVSYASLSVPEAKVEPRIRSRKLSEFLRIYQNVLKNLARWSAKQVGKAIPKSEDPYETDVFGFCHGSFTVQVRSAEPCDLLGENRALSAALSKLNEFLDTASNPDDAIQFLQSVKGHTASSLIGLLNFIADNECPLKNSWSTPGMYESRTSQIRVASAKNVIDKCRLREDLSTEIIDITGVVDSADVTRRTWKIISNEAAYSGSISDTSNINLSGIVMGDHYKFICEEKIETIHGTGKERKLLNLVSFEPVDPSNHL